MYPHSCSRTSATPIDLGLIWTSENTFSDERVPGRGGAGRLSVPFLSVSSGNWDSSLIGKVEDVAIAGSSEVSSAMLSNLTVLVGVPGPDLVLQDWLGPSACPAPS